MIAPNHPIRNSFGNYLLGLPSHGFTPHGRFVEFDIRKNDFGEIEADWTIQNLLGAQSAVYVFRNGTFLPPKIEGTFWSYAPSDGQTLEVFEFLVGPKTGLGPSRALWFREKSILKRVLVSWDLDLEATKSAVYKSAVNSSTVDTTEGNEVRGSVFDEPTLELTGDGAGNIEVAGTWRGDVPFGCIQINLVDDGEIGVSRYTWTFAGRTSNPIPTHSVYQFLINGVKLKWADRTYSADGAEDFNVCIRLPTQFTTQELANGKHKFQIGSWRGELRILSDSIAEIDVQAVPDTATVFSSSYTDGTGTATIQWEIPAETGIRAVELFRNYPASGIQDLHWRPIERADVTAGAIYTATVTGLQEGLNKVCPAVINNGERNDSVDGCFSILLDSSLNEVSYPTPPYSIKAVLEEDLTITLTVAANHESDSFEVYHDGETGVVDYGTVWATVANPQAIGIRPQSIVSQGHYLPDGDYILACRAKSGSVVETNEDVVFPLTVNTTAPPKATNVAAVLVE